MDRLGSGRDPKTGFGVAAAQPAGPWTGRDRVWPMTSLPNLVSLKNHPNIGTLHLCLGIVTRARGGVADSTQNSKVRR